MGKGGEGGWGKIFFVQFRPKMKFSNHRSRPNPALLPNHSELHFIDFKEIIDWYAFDRAKGTTNARQIFMNQILYIVYTRKNAII